MRIKITQRICLFLLIVVLPGLFPSCNVKRPDIQVRENLGWKTSFKIWASYFCLCEATNNEFHTLLRKHNDSSFGTEPDVLKTKYIKIADSIGRDFAKKNMYSRSDDPSDDLYNLVPRYSRCMVFQNSTYLDSLASSYLILYRKDSLEMEKDF